MPKHRLGRVMPPVTRFIRWAVGFGSIRGECCCMSWGLSSPIRLRCSVATVPFGHSSPSCCSISCSVGSPVQGAHQQVTGRWPGCLRSFTPPPISSGTTPRPPSNTAALLPKRWPLSLSICSGVNRCRQPSQPRDAYYGWPSCVGCHSRTC